MGFSSFYCSSISRMWVSASGQAGLIKEKFFSSSFFLTEKVVASREGEEGWNWNRSDGRREKESKNKNNNIRT